MGQVVLFPGKAVLFQLKAALFRFTQEAVLLINSRNDERCHECSDRKFVQESNLNGLSDVTLAAFFDFYEDVRVFPTGESHVLKENPMF